MLEPAPSGASGAEGHHWVPTLGVAGARCVTRVRRTGDLGETVSMSGGGGRQLESFVRLRPIVDADVERYVALQDEEMADRFEWVGPVTVDSMRPVVARWVESWERGDAERNYAIIEPSSGDMVGDCELELRCDGYVHVMYALFGPWRSKGFGTRAAALLVSEALQQWPTRPLLFRVHPDNLVSKRVAQRQGAHLAGIETSANGRDLERWVLAFRVDRSTS